MAVSVRMDPLLEKEMALAAKRRGVTKSQFIVEAVERALNRKHSYNIMIELKAQEPRIGYEAIAVAYDTNKAKAAIKAKLKRKHVSSI
jgi:predicted DNA-binding protein